MKAPASIQMLLATVKGFSVSSYLDLANYHIWHLQIPNALSQKTSGTCHQYLSLTWFCTWTLLDLDLHKTGMSCHFLFWAYIVHLSKCWGWFAVITSGLIQPKFSHKSPLQSGKEGSNLLMIVPLSWTRCGTGSAGPTPRCFSARHPSGWTAQTFR